MRILAGAHAPGRRPACGTRAAAALVLALAALVAQADVVPYQAVVPLRGATEADRAAAMGEALKVAAVRGSGRSEAATSARIVSAAASPGEYVQQYGTTADRMLKVGFDARAMEQLLLQAGLPVWPAERPAVTVYLFTTGVAGGARAVLAAERPPERQEIERAAQRRGVPLLWPTAQVDLPAARQQLATGQAVLVGSGAGGVVEWNFAHAGASAQETGNAAAGPELAADRLADRYATAATRSLNEVELRVGGLRGVRDYAALLQYLEDLSLVREVDVREFAGEGVRLALHVRGDRELLARIFALDRRLVPFTAGTAPGTTAADFNWQPR